MVANEIEPKVQAEMDGFEEPKPIMYLGGPLTGQTRADDGKTRRVVKVGADCEVYYRTAITVKKDGVQIELFVMAYHGKEWAESLPVAWQKKAEKDGQKEEGGEAVAG